jgi:AcrR family transcriptional regulator
MAKKKIAEPAAGMRERILEAAKEQFAEHGLERASVRAITDRAKANSSMLGYYFGSKDELFQEVIGAIVGGLVRHRLAALDLLRDQHPDGIPLASLFRAYAEPVLTTGHPLERDVAVYLRFFGRLYTEPSDRLRKLVQSQLTNIQQVYIEEIGRSAPHLDTATLSFRFGLMMGSLTLLGARVGVIELLSDGAVDCARSQDILDRFANDYAALFAAA